MDVTRWLARAGRRSRPLANMTAAVSLGAAGLGAQALVSAPAAQAATSVTFNYTGAEQTYAVPPGVTEVTVTAVGGIGGGYYFGNSAMVTATVPLPAGTTSRYPGYLVYRVYLPAG